MLKFLRSLLACSRAVLIGFGLVLLAGSALHCTNGKTGTNGETAGARPAADDVAPDTTEAMTIQEALEKHKGDLMTLDGVNGVGQGRCEGEPCIKVFVVERTDSLAQEIPEELENYLVRVEETGTFRTQPVPSEDSSQRAGRQ